MPELQTDVIAALRDSICQSGDRMITVLDGLTATQLNWVPPAEGANSSYAIASHAFSAYERMVLDRVFGLPPDPLARSGWGAQGDSVAPLQERWSGANGLRARLAGALSNASQADLAKECEHPAIGRLSGWQLILMMRAHMAEHIGQVELTRDLAKAAGA